MRLCIQLYDELFKNPIAAKAQTFSKVHTPLRPARSKQELSGILQLNTQQKMNLYRFILE
jgi:hypothetical protein